MMEQFDKRDMSAMLKLESALDRERIFRQVLPEAAPVTLDCKMKAREKYQSDLWLEIEHLNKGLVRQDQSSSSLALFNATANVVAQCETDPVENIFEQNLKIKFYISSGSTSSSSYSGDEADSVKIVDSAHLPVHTPTIKRREDNSRILFPTKIKTHQFFLTNFTAPTKCHQCTSLMVGLIRQGCACDGYSAPYLSVYSENAVDIFDVNSMEWIQTVPLKKVRPLNSEGSLNILLLETIRLIYFKNKMTNGDELALPETSDDHQKQVVQHLNNKQHYFFRVPKGKGVLPKGL
nr:hypothetical protein HJG63_010642 [Rousettus aegyptiacus]